MADRTAWKCRMSSRVFHCGWVPAQRPPLFSKKQGPYQGYRAGVWVPPTTLEHFICVACISEGTRKAQSCSRNSVAPAASLCLPPLPPCSCLDLVLWTLSHLRAMPELVWGHQIAQRLMGRLDPTPLGYFCLMHVLCLSRQFSRSSWSLTDSPVIIKNVNFASTWEYWAGSMS